MVWPFPGGRRSAPVFDRLLKDLSPVTVIPKHIKTGTGRDKSIDVSGWLCRKARKSASSRVSACRSGQGAWLLLHFSWPADQARALTLLRIGGL
jgi:hypothetical protein